MEITLNNMRMKARWPREFLLPISVIKSSELRLCTCDLCTLFAFPHCGFNTMTQSHEPAAFNRILTLGRFPSPLQQNFGWEESNLSLLELLEHTHAAWRAHIIAFSTLVTHDPLFRRLWDFIKNNWSQELNSSNNFPTRAANEGKFKKIINKRWNAPIFPAVFISWPCVWSPPLDGKHWNHYLCHKELHVEILYTVERLLYVYHG